MKANTTCHGEVVKNNGFRDRRNSYYPCTTRPRWRVEWLAEPKVGKPLILHLMTACSSHLVQVLNQAHAGAMGGEVHVLRVTDDTEWWPGEITD